MTTDQDNLIQCRAGNGVAIQTSQPWEAGKPVSFIYAPAGRHMITAGFRKGETITICVENDSQTAVDLQESYDHLMATEPNQEPFGDEDHESKKATLRFPTGVTKFSWGEIKGNEGVIVAAEPTSYGSEAVNGKVYRSWSPEFATDADYTKARQKNKHWTFPDGVKGSESNPARIVGVSFVMGALTNRPAFRAMPPVKAKKADAAIEDGIQAGGPGSGRRKGDSNFVDSAKAIRLAWDKTQSADSLSTTAAMDQNDANHEKAKVAHAEAASHHKEIASVHEQGSSRFDQHDNQARYHESMAAEHESKQSGYTAKASSPILAHQADELTLSDLQSKVQATASADSRFKGVSDPSGCIPCCGCYVADIIRDEDQNEWFAVISAGSKMKRVEFLIDAEDGSVVLGDEVKEVARKTVYAVDALCYNGEVVKAAGNSEGAKKGWQGRSRHLFENAGWKGEKNVTHAALLASKEAESSGRSEDHELASDLHSEAKTFVSKTTEPSDRKNRQKMHHSEMSEYHKAEAGKSVKSSSPDLSSLYLKGAAQEPTLEQIFARVGANGVPAAVTN
jgi:hypothetical protein